MLRLLTVSLTGRATTGTMLTLLVAGCDVYTPDLVSGDGTTLEGDNGTDGTDDTDGADSTSDGIDTSATSTSGGDSLGTSGASTTTSSISNSLGTSMTADDTTSGDDSGSASTNSGSNSDSSTASTDTAQNDSNDDGSGTTTTESTAGGEAGAGSTMTDAMEEPDDGEGGSPSVVIGAGGAGSDEPLMPTPLIDDMEDGNAVILGGSDRMGTWFTFNDCQDTDEDCSGTQTPEAGETFMMESGGYDESDYAARSAASGFEVWGSGFGVNLNGGTQAYDASMFSGISFWAKGALAPAGAALRVEFVSTTTDTESSHFGFDICLASDWQQFSLPFSDSTQPTWAMDIVTSLDPASIKSINFKTAENVDHDVWLDDLMFSEGAASEELHCE